MTKTSGLKRSGHEQYYTQQDVANQCVKEVDTIFKLESFDCITEPSAGTGAFLSPLKEYNLKKVLAYDIDPKEETIIKADFLQTNIQPGKILVIGNPPFGRQASLAKQFIKHSCKFAEVIAFILPRSFKKTSMSSAFMVNFHKVFEKVLDPNSFVYETKEYAVPCVFQIWEKKNHNREMPQKVVENDKYKVIKKADTPNVAFRRVGVYAGKFTFENFDDLSPESHYFIKTKLHITEDIRNKLASIEWQTDNTTGPKSISKQELIQELNDILP